MKNIVICVVAILAFANLNAQEPRYPFNDPDLSVEQRTEDLLGRRTLEEKVGMMMNGSTGVERLGIPDYNWWNEALHGVARAGIATVFPQAIGMAATFDPEEHLKTFTVISDEARAKYNCHVEEKDFGIYKGLTMWSPNINIFRDPRWGRGQETYGEDPYLTASIGCEFVRGLQGDGEFLKVSACAKHLAVHSGPEKLRHTFNAISSQKDLFETYLPAFERLVKDAKVEGVMGAYNRTNDEACCAHSQLMDDVLFKQWGFEGYFVSDCGAICNFHKTHMITPDGPHSAALALSNR
jgi:beta-glucosidase